MIDTYTHQKKLLICGNGGSSADSGHIVGELMKGFLRKRPLSQAQKEVYGALGEKLQQALPAIDLTAQSALMTAFANDVDPSMIFAQQVYGYGEAGDLLLAFSTSGNSPNIINAVTVASAKGMRTIGFTGDTGGSLKQQCDICICVPAMHTHQIQEYHLPIYHALCAMVEEFFFVE